ncbi:MAG: hypothetical protein JWO67_2357 [Streptosporangiaceae bacterium]|nr:hypothetical protein [Streptosporangiaceae bacterium]
MSRPLPYGDPTSLGPFQLTARLSQTPAGITYLGTDPAGRQVSVAVMTRGAAGDAAARDRFRAAILAADQSDPAPVVAAEPHGPAPWVATTFQPDAPGAERFLDAVLLEGSFGDGEVSRRGGPQFQPYWIGSREPALGDPGAHGPPGGPETETGDRGRRGVVATMITLVALLALLLLLMSVLYACRPVDIPQPVPTDLPSQPYDRFPPLPTPTPAPPTPSPRTTETGAPTGGLPGDGGAA